MENVYSKACSMGYPYIRGWGKASKDGNTWLTRFSKSYDAGIGPCVFIGWDNIKKEWTIEEE